LGNKEFGRMKRTGRTSEAVRWARIYLDAELAFT